MLLFVNQGLCAKKLSNKQLTIGISQEFENLNPLVKQMSATSYIYSLVGRSLVGMDADGKTSHQLAVTTPTLENSMAKFDGKGKNRTLKVDWEIKKNASWGDGKPVTGHDYKFTWKVAMTDTISISSRDAYENILDIVVNKANPKKFSIIYKSPKWNFNRRFAFYALPKHLEEAIYKKYKSKPGAYEKNSMYVSKPTHPGLYNGPYVINEVKLGSHVVVTQNKHFYGKAPKIKKIVLKLIPNTNTLEANLRSGNIDMISSLGLSFDQALALDKKVKKTDMGFDVKFKQSLTYEHIDLQLKNKILQDIQVRKALSIGIDKKGLVDALFEGKQYVAHHSFAPIDPWYTDNSKVVVKYKYSRRSAKKMLDKAGWKLSADGFRYKNGQKLAFTIMTTSGNKVRELVQVYLKDQWKKIGVDVQIKNEPARILFGETFRKSKYKAMIMYAWTSLPEESPKTTFHSEFIPTKSNSFTGNNSMNWKNKKVDAILEELDGEFDQNKRIKLAHQIINFYTDEIPVIPLYFRADVSVVPKKLSGYRLTGHSQLSTNHVENWSVE